MWIGHENNHERPYDFLVNALTGAFGISIAENGEIDPEDIYEVLVGATADGTSISTLCERSEDSYSGNDILYHLRTKFDLDTVRSVGNALLREYTLEMLPEQVEIVRGGGCQRPDEETNFITECVQQLERVVNHVTRRPNLSGYRRIEGYRERDRGGNR
jgi:hypothetical protein